MSAPITDQSLSSISSSGHVDGLGRRLLAFDRETGAMLERLLLRPELAAFETAIRDRIDTLAALDDERFARPGSVERDPATGTLTVLSEFVAGSRLSDLLETAEEAGLVPGVDVALGFLLEALPALSTYHTATGHSHGLIAPPRVVLTPAGQVVFLDAAFGSVVERLGLSKTRLWTELGIAAPQEGGPVRLDAAGDIAQVALSAMMLVIGRRLREHEYPDALPSLLMEVIEVAQIRGSSLFATSLQRLLQRSLPVPGRRPFGSADELANEIRLLLRREIGAEVCREALIDFIEQMDAEFAPARSGGVELSSTTGASRGSDNGHDPLNLDDLSLDALDSIEVLDVEDDDDDARMNTGESGDGDEDEEFEEIPLEPEVFEEPPLLLHQEPVTSPIEPEDNWTSTPVASPVVPEREIADPWSFDRSAAERLAAEAAAATDVTAGPPEIRKPDLPAPVVEAAAASPVLESVADREPAPEASPAEPAAELVRFDPGTDRSVPESGAAAAAPSAPPAEGEPAEDAASAAHEDTLADEPPSNSSRRKKRQHKSARARKDKLRSATAPPAAKPQPQAKLPETAAPARAQSGWLVNPDRAAAFAPPVAEPPMAQPPVAVGHVAPAPIPPPAPVAPPIVPQPMAPPVAARQAIPMPVYGTPAIPTPVVPPVPIAVQPPAVPAPKPIAPSGASLRVKATPPSGYAPPRSNPSISAGPNVHRGQMFGAEEPRRFPWKLALLVLVAVGIAIVVGRSYLPSKDAIETQSAAGAQAPEPQPAVVVIPKVETGHITIDTQPAGARVLLNGKPVGQSPLKLADVPVGRHTLTFISPSGEVTRTVRVAAGKTAAVDVPIFSGWVAVFAPVVLDVAVNGRSIGTTERDRLMLSAGRHELTLTNKELGYKSVQEVEVQPGEVRSLTVDPRGPVNFNAVPWAEVWMDGKKIGDTPLANMRVPLGTREFVFKNPQYGERKVTATVRADQPSAIGVDFTRPQ